MRAVAAAVAAQIEHVGLRALRPQAVERARDLIAGLLAEGAKLQISDAIRQHPSDDLRRHDPGAHDRDGLREIDTVAA